MNDSLHSKCHTTLPLGFHGLLAKHSLHQSSLRGLVVDDFEPWQRFVSKTVQNELGMQVVGEVSDGLQAVQTAQELKPDLIVLDIGLLTINGIDTARRIRQVSPTSKILFLSEDRSLEIAEEALSTGAYGYVVKSDVARDLLTAVKAVLEGKRFVSVSLAVHQFADHNGPQSRWTDHRTFPLLSSASVRRHEVGFYSDDRLLLHDLTQFIGAALTAGNSAIVVATESHRSNLFLSLQASGLDVDAAVRQGRYITLDAAETLSKVMRNDILDSGRVLELLGRL